MPARAVKLCSLLLLVASSVLADDAFEVIPVADLSADGNADIAVLPLSGNPDIQLYSSRNSSLLDSISYFNEKWMPIAFDAVNGGSGEVFESGSLVAVLAANILTGKIAVQVRDIKSNGVQVGQDIPYFSSEYRPIDVAVLGDTNGDGNYDDPSIAVLAESYSTGRQAVMARTLNGETVLNWTVTRSNQQVLAIAGVSMPGRLSRIAVLVSNTLSGTNEILSVRIGGGVRQPMQVIGDGGLNPIALDLAVQNDGNGDGQVGDPAYVILARHSSWGSLWLYRNDVQTGSGLGSEVILRNYWDAYSVSVANNLLAGSGEDVLISASRKAFDELLVNVSEPDTGALVKNLYPALPPEDLPTKFEAFRFLNQASLGATEAEAEKVIRLGYSGWIEEQMRLPASLSLPHVSGELIITGDVDKESRSGIWIRNAIHGRDQLRQRVAFALSEIMVVSEVGQMHDWVLGIASYNDMLANNAFGNYRTLMEGVTLHPAMGMYLSMLGNQKPDPERNIRPDENYARELLQLFTIGLVELNINGTEKTDARGYAIPTYDQEIVQGFAHVFTGWNFEKRDDDTLTNPGGSLSPNNISRTLPMVLTPDRHDTASKTLLNGVTLPARENGERDLRDALDNVFQHPNVGPFVSMRLIERLVTSNPSPAYVARVARVFNDNGFGERGDIGAVVKAILLDKEARPELFSPVDGKLKEPLLRLTQLWRAFNAEPADGRGLYRIYKMWLKTGQGPLQAESVFNFFLPGYAPPGEIRDQQLVAPEMQISTEYLTSTLR